MADIILPMFKILLISHVIIAVISLFSLGHFALLVAQGGHTRSQAIRLVLGVIAVSVSGFGLMVAGANVSRTCATLSVYVALCVVVLHFGRSKGYRPAS